jgi:hypothetical protein
MTNEQFWSFVSKQENGCWLWIAGTDGQGYGVCKNESGRKVLAHRRAYALLKGGLSSKIILHHKKEICSSTLCINPDHLEKHTHSSHPDGAVAWQRNKTHCKNGHPFNEENTYYPLRGGRACRTCDKLRHPGKKLSKIIHSDKLGI